MSAATNEKKPGMADSATKALKGLVAEGSWLDRKSGEYRKTAYAIVLIASLAGFTALCAGYTGPTSGPDSSALRGYSTFINSVPNFFDKILGPVGFMMFAAGSMGLMGTYLYKTKDKQGMHHKILKVFAITGIAFVAFFGVSWFCKGMGNSILNPGKPMEFGEVPLLGIFKIHTPHFFPMSLPPIMMELGFGTLATAMSGIAFGLGGLISEKTKDSKYRDFTISFVRMIAIVGAGIAAYYSLRAILVGKESQPYMLLTSSAAPMGIAGILCGSAFVLVGLKAWLFDKPTGMAWLSAERIQQYLKKAQSMAGLKKVSQDRADARRSIELQALNAARPLNTNKFLFPLSSFGDLAILLPRNL